MCLWNVYLWMFLSTCRSVSDQDRHVTTKNLDECVSWMCSRLYYTRFEYTHLRSVCFLISFHPCQAMYTCVFWMFCGRQVCGELLNTSTFYSNCLTVELGANCDAFTGHSGAFTIRPNHVVKQKVIACPQSVTSEYLVNPSTRLPHKPTQAISLSWFI